MRETVQTAATIGTAFAMETVVDAHPGQLSTAEVCRFERSVGENIHRSTMSMARLERQVSKLTYSDARPRPTTGRGAPRGHAGARLPPAEGRRGALGLLLEQVRAVIIVLLYMDNPYRSRCASSSPRRRSIHTVLFWTLPTDFRKRCAIQASFKHHASFIQAPFTA
jgi:hypothetical protein